VVGRPCRAAGGFILFCRSRSSIQCEQAGAGRVGDTFWYDYERFSARGLEERREVTAWAVAWWPDCLPWSIGHGPAFLATLDLQNYVPGFTLTQALAVCVWFIDLL